MFEKILIVDDEPDVLYVLKRKFTRRGYEVHLADSGDKAWIEIGEMMFDLVISDMAMKGLSGLGLLKRIRTIDPVLPFIVITGVGTIENAVEAIKQGAFQYITKPFKNQELEIVAQRAIEYGKLNRHLRDKIVSDGKRKLSNAIVGKSRSMREIMKCIKKISGSTAPVFIQGETGTGKSLLADAIHKNSNRRQKPFVTVDCASLPSTLLESELFGHVKGAFTGAINAKRGLLEDGDGGTIFLDEICEIGPDVQVKLLRAIQEKIIKPVGGNKTAKIDVRFISATNRKVDMEVQKGKFREDLYYRLSVLPIHLPPLRERKDDIPDLIDFFVKKFSGKYNKKVRHINNDVVEFLTGSSWKGNIRELENVLERAVILEENNEITMDCFIQPGIVKSPDYSGNPDGPPLTLRDEVEIAEKKAIMKALKYNDYNRSATARILGINRKTLYDKISNYNIALK